MPPRLKRGCGFPGCKELTTSTYCEHHAKQKRKRYDLDRGTASQRGYDRRWQRAREIFLNAHPLCKMCEGNGLITAATVVDHIEPHRGNEALFWDESNWQALCARCHNRHKQRQEKAALQIGEG